MVRPPFLLAAVLLVAAGPARALPPVVVERHVLLSVDVLLVEGDETRTAPSSSPLEIGPDIEEKATLSVPWGTRGGTARIHVAARLLERAGPDGEPAVQCVATVEIAGRAPKTSSRALDGEGTALLDVHQEKGRRIVLALRTEAVDRPVVRRLAKVGEPVRFLVAVERVDGERTVLLETNHLNTFVGQSVSYSFRLGQDAALQDVRLDLLPVAVSGDLVTIDTGIVGALPGAGGTSLVSRQERIVASRRATSTVSAVTGTPPAGYRFQVTPDF